MKSKNNSNNIVTVTDNDDKIESISMKFDLDEIELEHDTKINFKNFMKLENVDINDIVFTIDNEEHGYIEGNYFIAKDKIGEVNVSAKYKDVIATTKVNIVMFYTRFDTKTIYFYDNNGKIEYIGNANYNETEKRQYDDKYVYFGKYTCNSDKCNIDFDYGNFALTNENVLIHDNSNTYLYNYKKEEILATYDFGNKFYGEDYVFVIKNDKVAITDMNGKLLTGYYEEIGNYKAAIYKYQNQTSFAIGGTFNILIGLKNVSFTNDIATYKIGNKYGLLSLTDGKELTDDKYDNISIYYDSIVVTLDNLKYAMNETGSIISKGYNEIWYSTDDVLVIKKNDYIDIVDYEGNSKITNKIEAKDKNFNRICPLCYGPCTIENDVYLNSDGTLSITVNYQNYKFDLINNTLTKP